MLFVLTVYQRSSLIGQHDSLVVHYTSIAYKKLRITKTGWLYNACFVDSCIIYIFTMTAINYNVTFC